jgi:hypothetical protein
MELSVAHSLRDIRVAELLLEQVQRHPGASEVHGSRMAMIMDRVA